MSEKRIGAEKGSIGNQGLIALYHAEREELEPLLHSIVKRATELLHGRGGGMYLYDRAHGEAVCVVSHNTPKDYTGVRLKLNEGAAGWVIRTGEPLIIDDYRDWEGRAKAFEQDRPFTAVISAPMKWGEETIGVIHVLDDVEVRAFTETDLKLLCTFADQAAITLKNAKLYRESRRWAGGLAALHRVSLKLTAQRDLTRLLEEIVRSALKLLGAKGGGIYLYDPKRGELELTLSLGMSKDYRGTRLKLGEGLAGKVAQSGEPMIIRDYKSWEGRSSQYAAEPLTSVISVPLISKDKIVGALNISTYEEDKVFDEGDLELAMLFADQAAIAIENARLYQEERRRARELEALAAVSTALSSSLELEEVLEKALEEMLQVSEMEAGAIYLLDEEQDELRLVVHRGGVEEVLEQVRTYKLGQGLTGKAAAERRVVVCPDLLKEFSQLKELIERSGVRSQISLPLLAKGKLLGVLNLNSVEVYTPSEDELRLLSAISEQIALAIENAELYHRESWRRRREAALSVIGQALSQSLEIEQLLDKALEGLLRALELDLGGVYLIEDEQFVLKAHRGLSSEFARAAARNPLDHPILGRVIRSREPLELSEFTSPAAAEEGIKHAAYISLNVQDKPLGVLIVGDRTSRRLTPEELDLLKTVGSQLGLALSQAELYRQLHRSYRSLQVAYKISQLISGSLDAEKVLQQLVRTAVEELGFEMGYLTIYSEEERALRVRTIYPRDERLAQALEILGIEDLEGYAFPIRPEFEPILKRWLAGEPVVTDSYYELVLPNIPREAAEAVQRLYGVRQLVELPLRAKERFIGTLLLATKHPRVDEELLQLLQAIASQAAIALENAALYQEAVELGNKYQSLVENELVGVYIIQDGIFKYANRGLCEMFGYRQEEVIGRLSPLDLVHPEDHRLVLEKLRERLEEGKEFARYSFRGVRKDGEIFDCEVLGRRIEYEGRPAVQGILRDISQAREAERLRRSLLEVASEILASYDIERILRRVAEAVVEHSPFQRAAVSLYDLKCELPLEGALVKAVAVGLTEEEEQQLRESGGLTPERRKLAFSEEFRVGRSYYIPHDRVPWEPELGIPGRVSLDGWHPEDFLLIPLRGERGIIGHISVDDPTTPRAPTLEMLEPLEVFAGLAALAVERAAHMEEIRRQKERMGGIYNFSHQLVRESGLDELFQKALEMLEKEFEYDYATIMLLDGGELEVVAERLRFRSEKSFLGKRFAPGEGLSGWAAEHRQSVLVNDCSQDPRFVPSFKEIQSELIAPLLFGNELLGVVDVESRQKGAFTPDDEELLNSIAAQLAVAIREVRAREKLRGAYHIGQELARYRTREGLLNGILRILQREFHYDYGAVMLRRGDELVVEAVESTLAGREIDLGTRIPLERGITGWVARHKQPALVNDVTADPRYLMGHKEIRSELAVPILLEEELLGVLNVESTAENQFKPEDQEFLTSVAAQLAVAIAELRGRERLRRAYGIGQELVRVEEIPKLIDYVLRQLEQHFAYDWGLILLREGDILKLAGQLGRGGTRVFHEDTIEIGQGLIGWVAQQRKSLRVDDVAKDPRYIRGFLETRSELIVPIQTPEELFGVIDIQSKEVAHFTAEDELVLESLAGQMAIALSNIKRKQELKELSLRDPLTGLYNRRHLSEVVAQELERSRRYGHSLAFLMIDLDNFREVNNRYGHLKGDEVLREIAQLLLRNVRAADIVFRYGGDEFLILMPETDSEAQQASERLKQAVEEWNERSGLEVQVGISIGVTSWSPEEERGAEEVLAEADRWMYQAKGVKGCPSSGPSSDSDSPISTEDR